MKLHQDPYLSFMQLFTVSLLTSYICRRIFLCTLHYDDQSKISFHMGF